jgi:hypothetical protein
MNEMEHEMTTIGYARVSTDGQTLQAQTEALHAAGCARIFAEKISGAHSDRPQLAKALAALAAGASEAAKYRHAQLRAVAMTTIGQLYVRTLRSRRYQRHL